MLLSRMIIFGLEELHLAQLIYTHNSLIKIELNKTLWTYENRINLLNGFFKQFSVHQSITEAFLEQHKFAKNETQ